MEWTFCRSGFRKTETTVCCSRIAGPGNRLLRQDDEVQAHGEQRLTLPAGAGHAIGRRRDANHREPQADGPVVQLQHGHVGQAHGTRIQE